MTSEGPWTTFKEWWIHVNDQLRKQDLTEIVDVISCVLWQLWKFRNEQIFDKGGRGLELILHDGITLASEFAAANPKLTSRENIKIREASLTHTTWSCPIPGSRKINVDAGWATTTCEGTVGVVARNERGSFCAAQLQSHVCINSALVAETLACRDGLEMALRNNWPRVQIENDCKTLVMVLNGEVGIPLKIDVLVADIHHFSRLLDVMFQFIRRTSNNVAHRIVPLGSWVGELRLLGIFSTFLARSSPYTRVEFVEWLCFL
ncbi:hypothetical protein LIER_14152 [Lithospermum erythrorhizon]|uniref:RNase H type-1 domain-containing protein n=1 Tax=Lithospermum erythrorhizon TaxID=34254 RepID=A0AAV3PZ26_LITER